MTELNEAAAKLAVQQKADALKRAEALELHWNEAAKIREEHDLDPRYVFPDLQGSQGGFHFDQESKVFWVAMDVRKLDYNGMKDFLDAAKFQVWMLAQQLQAKINAARQLAGGAPPAGKGGFGNLFKSRA